MFIDLKRKVCILICFGVNTESQWGRNIPTLKFQTFLWGGGKNYEK